MINHLIAFFVILIFFWVLKTTIKDAIVEALEQKVKNEREYLNMV